MLNVGRLDEIVEGVVFDTMRAFFLFGGPEARQVSSPRSILGNLYHQYSLGPLRAREAYKLSWDLRDLNILKNAHNQPTFEHLQLILRQDIFRASCENAILISIRIRRSSYVSSSQLF